jgi:hypothetical protein
LLLNVFHSIVLSNIFSLCPSLNTTDQVSHPWKKKHKILSLNNLIFMF